MEIVASLERTAALTGDVLANVKPDQLDAPTPCTDWDVRALLNHLVGGATMVAALGRDGRVDMSKMASDFVGDDPQGAWEAASAAATSAWQADGALARTVTMPWGQELPAPAALTILRNDLFQHTWDLAKATGQDTALDADLAETVWAAVQENPGGVDAFRSMGLFGPVVEVAEAAPTADKVAGFFGRTP
ncbi:MAG: TIGR03086 family metal-binding protein [Acidimicrobiia bacterium]